MLLQVLLILLLLNKAAPTTVTLENAPAYASQRPCAQQCYGAVDDGPDNLAYAIGCNDRDITNECLCRPDLQANADAYLHSCVSSECSEDPLDIASATSIYDAYCLGAGFSPAGSVATTTTGEASPTATTTVTVTAIQTIFISSGERRLRAPLEQMVARLGL